MSSSIPKYTPYAPEAFHAPLQPSLSLYLLARSDHGLHPEHDLYFSILCPPVCTFPNAVGKMLPSFWDTFEIRAMSVKYIWSHLPKKPIALVSFMDLTSLFPSHFLSIGKGGQTLTLDSWSLTTTSGALGQSDPFYLLMTGTPTQTGGNNEGNLLVSKVWGCL